MLCTAATNTSNTIGTQTGAAERHSSGMDNDSTVHSHVVLGLPAGRFQCFGGPYVSECRSLLTRAWLSFSRVILQCRNSGF